VRVQWEGKTLDLKTVWMEPPTVRMIDQRHLPHELRIFVAESYRDVATAIREMVVRGAPAIGAAAAYGMAQAVLQGVEPDEAAEELRATRPTGRDLFHAIEYMLREIGRGEDALKAAESYARLDEERCRMIGQHGESLVKAGSRILTHCNAGALACVDIGTVTAPLRLAHAKGRKFLVYVDETRPRLQGTRLTAWELAQEGIDHVVIADNAAGEDPDFTEFMMDVLVASPETVKQQPELVRKVVRALLRSNAWLLDHPAEQAVPIMKPVLGRLDETIILVGLQKTRLGIPRDGRVTERAVTLTQEFLRKVGALKTTIPYDQLVTNEFLPR